VTDAAFSELLLTWQSAARQLEYAGAQQAHLLSSLINTNASAGLLHMTGCSSCGCMPPLECLHAGPTAIVLVSAVSVLKWRAALAQAPQLVQI
jgi:hypothetical protein